MCMFADFCLIRQWMELCRFFQYTQKILWQVKTKWQVSLKKLNDRKHEDHRFENEENACDACEIFTAKRKQFSEL